MVSALTHESLFSETSYRVIAAPPLLIGASQLKITWPGPGIINRLRGALGTVGGVVNVIAGL